MNMIARMRLCWTAEKDALVGESDPRAAFLYAAIGDEIPGEVAKQFGLAEGLLPGAADEAALIAARRAEEEAAAQLAQSGALEREAAANAESDATAKAEADATAKAETKRPAKQKEA